MCETEEWINGEKTIPLNPLISLGKIPNCEKSDPKRPAAFIANEIHNSETKTIDGNSASHTLFFSKLSILFSITLFNLQLPQIYKTYLEFRVINVWRLFLSLFLLAR